MDFGTLLHVAQKNEKIPKKEIKYYSTKFEPPKKEERTKNLSDNIKKFLARKEAEERRTKQDAKVKKEELLALRSQDKKAQRRVQVMLKRTKSANKSVIQDAIDNDNTAVTLAGPSQPDEDDYGYVSQEASAYYNKMMAKYSTVPEEPKFPSTKSSANVNMSGTKDRVKAALLKEQEDALLPHKRKRKHKTSDSTATTTTNSTNDDCDDGSIAEQQPKPKPRAAAPPPMNFAELLKLAEKKQFEPIVIEQKEVKEETPMTKKQRKEFEREREWRERKEKGLTQNSSMPPPNKIPKLNPQARSKTPKALEEKIRPPRTSEEANRNKPADNRPPKATEDRNRTVHRPPKTMEDRNRAPKTTEDKNRMYRAMEEKNRMAKAMEERNRPPKTTEDKTKNSRVPTEDRTRAPQRANVSSSSSRRPEASNKPARPQGDGDRERPQYLKAMGPKAASVRPPSTDNKAKLPDVKSKQLSSGNVRPKVSGLDGRPKQFPPTDVRPKQFPPADVRPKQFPPSDVRPRQFPPGHVKRKPPMGHKRRILDDDEENDSEMDDFIDDGHEDGAEDYSRYIKEIFGYDRSRYRPGDDDDHNMESSFSQMMKEEFISSKIGLMEDLEDMRQEAIDKKKKSLMKKSHK